LGGTLELWKREISLDPADMIYGALLSKTQMMFKDHVKDIHSMCMCVAVCTRKVKSHV
jgi:hypothetical protein